MGAYYWAGGRRVPLRASDDLAVDLEAEALSADSARRLRSSGRELSGSLVVVPKSEADEVLGDAAGTAAGIHPVFRAEDGSTVVVLPQVRVESEDPRVLDDVLAEVGAAHLVERTDERLVLAPDSQRGEDALALANRIAESAHPDVSQARFVRVVPRPGPGRAPTH